MIVVVRIVITCEVYVVVAALCVGIIGDVDVGVCSGWGVDGGAEIVVDDDGVDTVVWCCGVVVVCVVAML